MPLDGDVRAAWATWDGDFEFRRTEYDVAKAAAGYRSLGGEFGEFAANADREGLGLDERRVDRDLDVPLQRLRNRAVLLGALGGLAKLVLVDSLDLAADLRARSS